MPIKVPVLVIYNTHPDFFWLTNYLETILSCYLWKPMTSATVARHYRILLDRYAEETGADKGFVQFQAHDFSFRGMSGPEDAALSGAGHLCSFVGTDTVAAIDLIEDYYNGDAEKELIGCSRPGDRALRDVHGDAGGRDRHVPPAHHPALPGGHRLHRLGHLGLLEGRSPSSRPS